MAVGGFVVDRRAALQDVLQLGGVKDLVLAGGAPDLFGERQRGAAIAVGHAHEHGARFRIERQLAAFDRFGMHEQLLDRSRVERMKYQHTRARQKRRVELEGRIPGGGADHDDRAVFHHRQE